MHQLETHKCHKDGRCWYLQSSALAPGVLTPVGDTAPGPPGPPGSEPGPPPAPAPVFLLSKELKKLARTPSLVVAAPGFTAPGSI